MVLRKGHLTRPQQISFSQLSKPHPPWRLVTNYVIQVRRLAKRAAQIPKHTQMQEEIKRKIHNSLA